STHYRPQPRPPFPTRRSSDLAAEGRAILVPTAERDPTIGLSIFQPLFRSVRALMYNSPEERAMIQAVSGNAAVPGVVVGIGSERSEEHTSELQSPDQLVCRLL